MLTACAVLGPLAFWLFGRDEGLPTYGPSMLPTLRGSEPLEIDFDAYDRDQPRLEDIVALPGPQGAATIGCSRSRAKSPCTAPAAGAPAAGRRGFKTGASPWPPCYIRRVEARHGSGGVAPGGSPDGLTSPERPQDERTPAPVTGDPPRRLGQLGKAPAPSAPPATAPAAQPG